MLTFLYSVFMEQKIMISKLAVHSRDLANVRVTYCASLTKRVTLDTSVAGPILIGFKNK